MRAKSMESRGYSTKVTFGEGEATVVENDGFYGKDRHPTWPRMENPTKEPKQILNKGLVVRIGREDSATNHTDNRFTYAKYQRSQNHSFKSTSLILNTIKDKTQAKQFNDKTGYSENKIPHQLEALKKLYEDVHSDSDADKEVQQLMSKIAEDEISKIEDDNSSVVSGSWSKMRAYKNVENFSRMKIKQEITGRRDLKTSAKLEKGTRQKYATERLNEGQTNIEVSRNSSSRYTNPSNYSPIALRKAIPVIRPDLKSAVTTEKLSSPSLVGRNYGSEFKNSVDRKLQAKHIHDSIVLRQPRKSEMTYFGVKLSPKPVKKISQAVIRKENNKLSEKPDLIQHYKKSPSPIKKIKSPSPIRTTKNAATSKTKPRQKSPDNTKIHSGPIYENLKEAKGRYTREFDSSILDELTKAADQILQAVNGYTDEDPHARLSTDEESKKRIEPLDTISETKSWKQQKAKAANTKPPNTKTRLKHTSSTSSVESITCSRRHTSVERKPAPARTAPERKKKSEKGESSVAKANTKARRLQRASSREALLQSHGSSSEDLAANVEMPIRKPRLIKKTKGVQLTVSNGFDIKKMPSSATGKKEGRGILGSLPEIRHKTAVSTIRSTADKTTREKTKHREELRKKTPPKREVSRGTTPSRTEKERIKPITPNKETVTHQISTAYVPVCRNRSRNMHVRQQDTDCPCLCS
ncbi:hypothetical protein NQ317_002841 [Molorchus minor]|uniref:Uncharacterized protein n=1 Tax=Molorchus minor TaxID=1323400 RepID=A0ABQ9JXU4_9CUCU|nr:hypothetical protein NQ317_002841 [Molorchus minor]